MIQQNKKDVQEKKAKIQAKKSITEQVKKNSGQEDISIDIMDREKKEMLQDLLRHDSTTVLSVKRKKSSKSSIENFDDTNKDEVMNEAQQIFDIKL